MQGATIVPRNLYFIEDTQNLAEIKHDNVFTAKTCAAINAKAKVLGEINYWEVG